MERIKKIIKLVLDEIAGIYLYFLAFYFTCLVLSFFFESWNLFFNWKAFQFSAIIFGILSLLSDKGKKFILSKIEPLKFKRKIKFIIFFKKIFVDLISFFPKKITKKNYLKIILMSVILIYILIKGIEVINFFILAYGLISVLFIMESRLAAGIALLFLISCPILLILKKEGMAETLAIYAYYFLVITVLTQIREYIKENREESPEKVIHS
ncbi:hypothetical protein KKH59_05435 [Patescibacteria group bacterium]|nr:hypothetical protein [Patescibacteria group bacterium]